MFWQFHLLQICIYIYISKHTNILSVQYLLLNKLYVCNAHQYVTFRLNNIACHSLPPIYSLVFVYWSPKYYASEIIGI